MAFVQSPFFRSQISATAPTIQLPGVSDDESRTINMLLQQLEAKTYRNWLRNSYYDGKRAIQQVGTVIPPQYYRLGLVLGWSAKAVDILARRCNLDGFIWPDGDIDALGFDDVWDGNHLGSEISSGIISSLLHGTSFLINTLGDTTAGEPAGMIHIKDALNATGEWDARARRLVNVLSVTDRDARGQISGLVLYQDRLNIVAQRDGYNWNVDFQEHPWQVPVEPLVYKPRVGRPFGTSRISRPVMSLHDSALRTVIRMEGHADVYSFPEMWMLGADESIFKNADGSQQAQWQVVLGRIKGVPDDEEAKTPRADIKQFAASSPQPHIDQLKQQAQLFSGETSIPLTSLGVSDMSNPTSSDSYIASREDLIAEAEGATDDWARPLRRSMMRALAMTQGLDTIPQEWRSIEPKWRSPVYLSRAAQADAGMKTITAIPWLAETEVGLEVLGLDAGQIKRAMSEKRRAQGALALRQIAARTTPPVVGGRVVTDGAVPAAD